MYLAINNSRSFHRIDQSVVQQCSSLARCSGQPFHDVDEVKRQNESFVSEISWLTSDQRLLTIH